MYIAIILVRLHACYPDLAPDLYIAVTRQIARGAWQVNKGYCIAEWPVLDSAYWYRVRNLFATKRRRHKTGSNLVDVIIKRESRGGGAWSPLEISN